MSFDQLVGQDRVVRFLKVMLKRQRIAHAYCFYGPRGVGKLKAAIQLAKAINCKELDGEACDHCHICRRIENGNHPDVVRIAPEGQSIKIEQIRLIKQEFLFGASEAVRRILIIQQADEMTLEAANSLLKFLEEPGIPMVAILITENMHALPVTVLSRCQQVRFAPLSPEIITKKLVERGADPKQARIAAHLASGVDEAWEIVAEDGFAQLCERVIKWSQEIISGNPGALVTLQTELLRDAEKERIIRMLDIMQFWFRDILNCHLKRSNEPLFSAFNPGDQKIQLSLPKLLHMMNSIETAKKALLSPVHPQAVLEQMVLAMQEGSVYVPRRRRSF